MSSARVEQDFGTQQSTGLPVQQPTRDAFNVEQAEEPIRGAQAPQVQSQPSAGVAPAASQMVDEEAPSRGVVSRVVTVEVSGSLTRLAAAGPKTTWSVDKNAHAIFQPTAQDRGYSDIAGECDIKNAVLHTMEILEIKSTFPCALGVNVTGVNGQHVSREGVKYSLIVTGDTKWQGERKLVEVDDMTNNEYLRKYPGMTPDKISSAGIVKVPGEPYVFVDSNHPIIEMLAVNADMLQVNMQDADLIDGRWYKVQGQVVKDCTELLDKQLLQHLPIVDLSEFSVEVERLGQVAWDRTDTVTDGISGTKSFDPLVERMMEKNNVLTLQLKVQYRFM